jgi:hypothetical protein
MAARPADNLRIESRTHCAEDDDVRAYQASLAQGPELFHGNALSLAEAAALCP